MTALERFQRRFGGKWLAIVQEPAFQEAMMLANVNTIKEIGSLTPEQIKENGVPILAGLAGRLAHEEELIKLSVVEPKSVNDIEATYPNPEDELVEQTNGQSNGNDESFLSIFQTNVPHETSVPQQPLTTKEKRQAAAAKARAAKQAKYKARLKARLSKSPKEVTYGNRNC